MLYRALQRAVLADGSCPARSRVFGVGGAGRRTTCRYAGGRSLGMCRERANVHEGVAGPKGLLPPVAVLGPASPFSLPVCGSVRIFD